MTQAEPHAKTKPPQGAFDVIVERVCVLWPDHRRFLDKTRGPESATAEKLAEAVLRLAGDHLDRVIEGYRWTCEMMLEEELYFRRNGSYRLSSFAEVNAAVYQAPELMGHYMDGSLLSQILWPNHLKVFDFYINRFLAAVAPGRRHLEVGPGHGLLLYFAARTLSGSLEGWDISPISLAKTADCLRALEADVRVRLACHDIMTASVSDVEPFDSIVISEVLEHVEDPEKTLRLLGGLLAPGGRIFVNIPVNSPMIDHIALFKTPEEVTALVERVGLRVEEVCIAPAAGRTEAAARNATTTINCAVIGRRQ